MNKLVTISAVALGLAGCNTSTTSITAAICSDAAALQASSVTLNSNQILALNGIVQSCAATAGGTQINSTTVVMAIINDALLLQASGLLNNVHIRAEAPDNQRVLERIKLHWDKFNELSR